MSTSGEIAGITFEKAFAIAVMAVPLVGRSQRLIEGVSGSAISCPMKTGFACVSKLLRESSMNPEAIGSEVLIFA
jgi:hypothetical protein